MHELTMWATPILKREDVLGATSRERLLNQVLREDQKQLGTKIGTYKASKTESDLLRIQTDEVSELMTQIDVARQEMESWLQVESSDGDILAEAWGVVYHSWGFHRIHSHHDAAWSGVYYVDMGASSGDHGSIEFIDSRYGAVVAGQSAGSADFKPRDGDLYMFPAWLQHWVTPHLGDRPRVVVAFNLGYTGRP